MVINKYKETQMQEGALTIYLALTMTVLLSLCLTMIKGAQDSAARLRAELVTDTAIESCFAEYHRELFRQYNLFAIDTSYQGSKAGTTLTNRHMTYYIQKNLKYENLFSSTFIYRDFVPLGFREGEIKKVRFLTDNRGAVFRHRAVEAIQDDIGLSIASKVVQWSKTVEDNGLLEKDIPAEFQLASNELDQAISEIDSIPEDYENPIEKVKEHSQLGFLPLVLSAETKLSEKKVNPEKLFSTRMKAGTVNIGNFPMENQSTLEQSTEKLFLLQYLKRYFGSLKTSLETDALEYQLEYLIGGGASDYENLNSVVTRLVLLRMASDYLYLQGNEGKKKAVDLVTEVIAWLLGNPELGPVFSKAVLLGWAYMEGLYDVKCLLRWKKVPLMKTDDTWHYSLEGIIKGESNDDVAEVEGEGLGYVDYLEILLHSISMDQLTLRAMNLIEQNIRLTDGNRFFRLDNCVDGFCYEGSFAGNRKKTYVISRNWEY